MCTFKRWNFQWNWSRYKEKMIKGFKMEIKIRNNKKWSSSAPSTFWIELDKWSQQIVQSNGRSANKKCAKRKNSNSNEYGYPFMIFDSFLFAFFSLRFSSRCKLFSNILSNNLIKMVIVLWTIASKLILVFFLYSWNKFDLVIFSGYYLIIL